MGGRLPLLQARDRRRSMASRTQGRRRKPVSTKTRGVRSAELTLVFLCQVVEPLVMRHDHLQGAIARISVRFAAIEL